MTIVVALTTLSALAMIAQAPPIAFGQNIREQIACAPMSLLAPPLAAIQVTGGHAHGRIMFGPGEPLIVNAGTLQGVQRGQQYFVRRYVHDRFTPASFDFQPHSIHTAGWVTIVDARDTMAVATVTHGCDGILIGDYLEPYIDPVVPTAALPGAPDFGHPGRIVMADERRQTGYEGLLMLVNRGTDHDVRAGQGLTIYRETLGGTGPLFTVGTATVVSVRPQIALIRVDATRDAVHIGDLIAIHRITP